MEICGTFKICSVESITGYIILRSSGSKQRSKPRGDTAEVITRYCHVGRINGYHGISLTGHIAWRHETRTTGDTVYRIICKLYIAIPVSNDNQLSGHVHRGKLICKTTITRIRAHKSFSIK